MRTYLATSAARIPDALMTRVCGEAVDSTVVESSAFPDEDCSRNGGRFSNILEGSNDDVS